MTQKALFTITQENHKIKLHTSHKAKCQTFYKEFFSTRPLIDKMNDRFVNSNTIQKHKSRENEIPDHREARIAKKHEKKKTETIEERDARRAYDHERKRLKLANEIDQQREKHLEYHRKLRSMQQPQQPQQLQQP